MSTIMDGFGTASRITRVNTFAETFRKVLKNRNVESLPIDTLLELSANACNVVPAQMRYALSFADDEGYVVVNYQDMTVRAVHAPSLVSA